MMAAKRIHPLFYEALLYGCAFILLLEWLLPLADIAELKGIRMMAGFAGLCFAVSFFPLPWWLSITVKGTGFLAAIQMICYGGNAMDFSWIGHFVQELVYNAQVLLTDNWQDFTPLFRAVLILVLIWLMSYLLHYWFVLMKRVLFFTIATVFYIAVLSTFLDYDARQAMIRVVVVSVIAMALANLLKAVDQEVVPFPAIGQMSKVIAAFVLVLAVTLTTGLASPHFKPQWKDPVPFMKQVTKEAISSKNQGSMRRVGYGNNDSQLGGSFVQDYTPIFTATVPTENYWRIETKDYYTGKGWENSVKEQFQQIENGHIYLDTTDNTEDAESHEARLEFTKSGKLPKLVYPYGISHVEAASGYDFYREPIAEAVHVQKNGKPAKLDRYELKYDYPAYHVEKLRKESANDPEAIKILYTQTPKDLPKRVQKLAEKITKPHQNRFDKAKAIEQYFSENGFHYETANVPIPSNHQDYVDQFLFDTKYGYCDNYSTAMAVMLRTIGIPARWAKGFASGEKVDDQKIGGEVYHVFEVTNANAHSWVEVYFPGTGWVPFEPTQGFRNLADFRRSEVNHPGLSEDKQESKEEAKAEPAAKQPEKKATEKQNGKDDAAVKKAVKTEQKQKQDHTAPILTACILLVLTAIAAVLYMLRWRLRTGRIRRLLYKHAGPEAKESAYQHLLKLLIFKKMPKRTDETLSEYARRIDAHFSSNEMRILTHDYEEQIYSGNVNNSRHGEFISLWEGMVRRIMA